MKRKPMDWERNITIYVFDRRIIARIKKKSKNKKNQGNNEFENCFWIWSENSQIKIYKI